MLLWAVSSVSFIDMMWRGQPSSTELARHKKVGLESEPLGGAVVDTQNSRLASSCCVRTYVAREET